MPQIDPHASANASELDPVITTRDAEIEFLRKQNAQLHEQLNAIRAKVHDGSMSAKQIVTALRTWLDRPK